jgi:phosphatidylinositol alpha-mannosyltransferase
MKIAIIGENYYPTVGGIQEHIYHQARFLRSAGHDVRILTGMPSVDKWAGPRDEDWVVRVGKAIRYGVMGTYTVATLDPWVMLRLRRLFARERFDLIHVHGPFDIGLPALAYLLYDGPKVATLHSAFKHSLGRWLASPWYRWVLRRTDAVIAVSPLAAATITRYASFPHTIIPNGVDVGTFASGKRIPRFDDGRRNLLYLGRIEPRNGLDLLIEALPTIVAAFPDVRLLVAGDGPKRAEYQAMIAPELRDRVVFLGLVQNEERPDLYASADLFVLPARFGGSFSILVLEALAAGAPVVSTPFVAPEHRDEHWRPVLLTRDYSPQAIADGVISALGRDLAERTALGRQVVQDYDWAQVGAKILRVYQGLVGSGA